MAWPRGYGGVYYEIFRPRGAGYELAQRLSAHQHLLCYWPTEDFDANNWKKVQTCYL